MNSTAQPNSTGPQSVVSFIDIGTYSVRLLIARIHANGSVVVLAEDKESVRLGGDEFRDNRLQDSAMQRAVLVISRFVEKARSYHSDTIHAVATAATREAKNQKQFVDMIYDATGVDLRVIAGREEARLIYLGVVHHFHLKKQSALFIDIGGGSTEMIVGDAQQYQYLDSMKIGSIRIAQMFRLDDPIRPITRWKYLTVQRYLRSATIRTTQQAVRYPFDVAIGSSGTVETLARMAPLNLKARSNDPTRLHRMDLMQLVRLLCKATLEERRLLPGINPDRADIIIGGAAVLESLMDQMAVDEIHVSSHGLKEGLLVDHIQSLSPEYAMKQVSARRRSVIMLGRRCHFDEPHAKHVAKLALQLFDATRELNLHDFDDEQRSMVEFAAMLHDIGVFLSFVSHHLHSYYLIRHADLIGFDQKQIAAIAALARYHRKRRPRRTDSEIASLDPQSRKFVKKACIFIRMAESLDRSHQQLITELQLQTLEPGKLKLHTTDRADATLELWAVRKHFKVFRMAFDCELIEPDDIESIPAATNSSTAEG